MANSNGATGMVINEAELRTFVSALVGRSRFAHLAGLTFNDQRDLYQICGYKRDLTYRDYRARYERGGIAARIINAFPAATWRNPPTIREIDKDNEEEKSPFEETCEGLITRLRLWSTFERADRLATLGHYAVLVIGVRGQQDLAQPLTRVSGPESIAWLGAYSEDDARIESISTADDETFGMPERYEIDFTRRYDSTNLVLPSLRGGMLPGKRLVHASRVIHIAENGTEDNIIGIPRLRPVWNYLDDLDKVVGGSGEMFWRDAKGRFHMALRDGAYLDPPAQVALDDKIEEMIHGLRDMIQTSGIDLNKLTGTVADPSDHIDKIVDLIAGTLPMPKRLLIGSERGELASDQDENNWGDVTIDRQVNYGEPTLARPFFGLAIRIGAAPLPRRGIDGYALDWPDPKPLTEQEKSLIALNWTKVIQTYASLSEGSIQEVLPLEEFLDEILGYEKEQIQRIMQTVERAKAEREADEAEERAVQEAAMRTRDRDRMLQEVA